MEIKTEYEYRLKAAIERADNSFWAVIADSFPEAKSGDYPPDLSSAREQHNREAVLWWLHYNASELVI